MRGVSCYWAPIRWCLAAFCVAAAGWVHAAPGGQGKFEGMGCFKTDTQRVPQVCGSYQIRWKLWSLMGEPIGDYNLSWKITSMQVLGSEGRSASLYPVGLPKPVADAISRTELGIEAVAFADSPDQRSPGVAALRFDTGASVRPGHETSVSVPSGYDWGKFLMNESNASGNWCASSSFMSAEAAKRLFVGGIRLTRLELCPRSTALVSIESALDRYCESLAANARPAYCEKVEGADKKPAAAAADAAALKARLAQMTEKYREEAAKSCEVAMRPIAACIANAGCGKGPAVTEQQCSSVPSLKQSYSDCMNEWSGCINCTREGHRRILEERCAGSPSDGEVAAWRQQWKPLADLCRQRGSVDPKTAACLAAAAPRCNPSGITTESCMQAKMKSAPTEADARGEMQQIQKFAKVSAERETSALLNDVQARDVCLRKRAGGQTDCSCTRFYAVASCK